jgi:long-chain fatty acid transport protein
MCFAYRETGSAFGRSGAGKMPEGKWNNVRTYICLPRARLSLLLTGALLVVVPAAGSGLESAGIGARGRAMGYAMVAVADDWTAIHYNPAGLVQISGAQFGFEYGVLSGRVHSTASLRNLSVGANPLRGDLVDPIGDEPSSFGEDTVAASVDGGALGYVIGKGKLAFGVGLYASGSGSSWEDAIDTVSGDTVKAEIAFTNVSLNIPLVLAYQATDDLALGFRVGVLYGLLNVDNNKSRAGGIPYVMSAAQETEGVGISVDLAALWKATDKFAFGAAVKFPYGFKKTGQTRTDLSLVPLADSIDTTVETSYPSRLALGCSFRPDDSNLLAFSMTWHDWSEYDQDTEYAPQIPGLLENSSGNLSNWHDALVFNLGYERTLNRRWRVRCGLCYDEAPEPEEARTLVGGQVVDAWKFAIGTALERERTTLDLGYMYTYGPKVGGYIPGAQYGATVHEFSVGVQRRF